MRVKGRVVGGRVSCVPIGGCVFHRIQFHWTIECAETISECL